MKKQLLSSFIIIIISLGTSKAGVIDTIRVAKKDISTGSLREGTHRYLVYFKMKKDSVRTQTQFWTREIKKSQYQGINVIEVNQSWEDKDSVIHKVRSISDAKTMQPIYHSTWWKVQRSRNSPKVITSTTVDYLNNKIVENGTEVVETDTAKKYHEIWLNYKNAHEQYHFNWHLDLETFPLLPIKDGLVFEIPFYEPGTTSKLTKVVYKVIGSDILTGYDDQKINCWLLVHESEGNKEVFWISKKTKEVLKLEQVINNSIYRFKIKLGFSN